MENDKPVLIYATYPNAECARSAAEHLVSRGLAACCNILAGMTAVYRWNGAIQHDSECVLIAKTRASLADHLIAEARDQHAYATAAFLVIPVIAGSEPYIAWLMSETESAGR